MRGIFFYIKARRHPLSSFSKAPIPPQPCSCQSHPFDTSRIAHPSSNHPDVHRSQLPNLWGYRRIDPTRAIQISSNPSFHPCQTDHPHKITNDGLVAVSIFITINQCSFNYHEISNIPSLSPSCSSNPTTMSRGSHRCSRTLTRPW